MNVRSHLTPQRKMVYEFVLHAANHPTATEIIDGLRESGHKLAYGTVYNSLHYLTEVGLIRELSIGDTTTRYDARTETHFHVVCRLCGCVEEWNTPMPEAYLRLVSKETQYQLEEVNLVIRGTCPKCAAKA